MRGNRRKKIARDFLFTIHKVCMAQDFSKEFLEKKKQVLDNLELMESSLSFFPEAQEGVADSFYDEMEALMERVESCKEVEELFELVEAAKEVEHNIDVYLSAQGKNQIELSWPEKA